MLLIKNGKIYLNGKFVNKNIIVNITSGKITGILNSLKSKKSEKNSSSNSYDKMDSYDKINAYDKIIDAKGLLVVPGFIDAHVHLRDPGLTYKEDFKSGSLAAANGGITHVIDMPNTKPPTTTKRRYDKKLKIAKRKSVVFVDLHMGTSKSNFDEIRKVKPNSLKIYMAETTGKLLVSDDKIIYRHFVNFDKNKIIVLHAEDQYYINKTKKRDKNSALIAIQRVNEMANKAGNRRIHIAHTTTEDEILLATARSRTTIEVAPHHLFLSERDRKKLGWDTRGKVYPPLRSEKERRNLWNAWDKINIIATDHAPHTAQDKENGSAGFPGLETSFSLLSTAYWKGKISLQSIIQKMSENPARLYGFNKEGKIKKGNYANLTFIDIKKEWKVHASEFFSKSKWSPFEGKKLKGKIIHTMVKGKMIKIEKS